MNWQATIIGVAAPVAALALGVLGYQRSRHVDRISEQSGVATDTRAGTAQIIEGLNGLIDNLQEDNKEFRADIRACALRLDTITTERDGLKRELARLRRRYGENGDTPPSTPVTE